MSFTDPLGDVLKKFIIDDFKVFIVIGISPTFHQYLSPFGRGAATFPNIQ